jgi:cell division protein FtsL
MTNTLLIVFGSIGLFSALLSAYLINGYINSLESRLHALQREITALKDEISFLRRGL